MIDTHCHLDEENYEDLNVIINEMKDNYMIASGYDIETSKKIAAKFLEQAINSLYSYDDVELVAKPKKRKRKY